MQEITRTAEITLVLMKDGRKLAEFYEPESGDFAQVELSDGVEQFSARIGAVMIEWLDYMEQTQMEAAQE